MTPLIVFIVIAGAYAAGRIHQFVRDARSVMGTDRHNQRRR